jgi:hypothetical protein
MRRMRMAAAAVVVGCTTIGLAACGNVAEKVAEKATERAIESETGGNADVDLDDDGSFKVRSDDGSFEVTSDGSLADGFPTDVPLVDGTVQASWSSKDGTAEAWWVTLEVDDAQVAYADAKDALAGAGYEITGTYEGTTNDQFGANLTAQGEWDVNVVVAEGDPSTVSYALTTPAG